jgi:hypothetical protein
MTDDQADLVVEALLGALVDRDLTRTADAR